jgi:hypothetical protein
MLKGLLSGVAAVTLLLLATAPATAGLSVSLTVNGKDVQLLGVGPNSGTPDDNEAHESGLVVVGGFAYNVDGGAPDFFVDALSVYASKDATRGMLETINWSARYAGEVAVPVVIEVWDLFAVPATTPGTPLDIISSFSYVNSDLSSPITLDSFLDGNLASSVTVNSAADLPESETIEAQTEDSPFELLSRFSFMLKPNSQISFRAESSAVLAANTAHAPEPASLLAWSSVIAMAGLVCAIKRRRRSY